MQKTARLANYTKKEQLLMSRQREKLGKYLSGIKSMTRLPGLLFIIDSKKERIAVSEANKLGVPIVAIVDTNADPDLITVPIAGNDDAIRSVELIAKVIGDTIAEARREAPARAAEDEQESFVYSTDRGSEGRDVVVIAADVVAVVQVAVQRLRVMRAERVVMKSVAVVVRAVVAPSRKPLQRASRQAATPPVKRMRVKPTLDRTPIRLSSCRWRVLTCQ